MNPLEEFRLKIIQDLHDIASWRNPYPEIKRRLNEFLGPNPSGSRIFEIGSNLSQIISNPDIRRGNAAGNEGQGQLAAAGKLWEAAHVWYLNLVFSGTSVIAVMNKKKFLPRRIKDAITVTVNASSCNSESDIVVFNVPETQTISPNIESINNKIYNNANVVDLTILQTKTNWNDNSQIPLLWDMIYGGAGSERVRLGCEGIAPNAFRSFRYAFSTLPSGRKDDYTSDAIKVRRVIHLSGGNYWGKPTRNRVASAISEFFDRNYQRHFNNIPIQEHIERNLSNPELNLIEKFIP